MKKTFIFYNSRAQIAINQMQNLNLWLTEKQIELPASRGVYC